MSLKAILSLKNDKEEQIILEGLAAGKSFFVLANSGTQILRGNQPRRVICSCETYVSALKTFRGWQVEAPALIHIDGMVIKCLHDNRANEDERLENKRNLLALMERGLVPGDEATRKQLKDEVDPPPATAYLCGPINGCTDEECKDWRAAAKAVLPNTIDPMVRDYRGREDECYKEIVELDKADIRKCGVVLVNYIKPSVGTAMEILFAFDNRIPVIVVAARVSISPWLRYHATSIVPTFQEGIALCAAVKAKRRGW